MSDKMRKEFLEWLQDVHGLESEWQPERNCFKDYAAHLAFQAWQASRSAVVIELPKPEMPEDYEIFEKDDPEEYSRLESRGGAQYSAIFKCKKAIEAAGMKVKS